MKLKKILSFFLAILFCFSLLIPSAFAAEESAIEQELKNVISFADYPANPKDTGVYLITLMEKGYNGTDFESSSGVYVYLYNPSKKKFGSSTDLNKIVFAGELQSNGMPGDFDSYYLELIESAKDGVLIKAKVKAKASELVIKSSDIRHYAVSEIELFEDGHYNTNAQAYTCGYDFAFTGSGEDLKCERTSFLTITLNVKNTSYITGDSARDGYFSNMITSVYFSVPNDIEEKYGKLYQIKYKAQKYYTAPMILVKTEDTQVYSQLMGYRSCAAADADISFYFGRTLEPGSLGTAYSVSDYAFNPIFALGAGQVLNELPFYYTVFKVPTLEAETEVLSRDYMWDYFSNYKASFKTGYLGNGWSADLFQSKDGKAVGDIITIKDTGHLPSYDDEHDNLLNKFWDWVLKDVEDETVMAQMIQEVQIEDFESETFSEDFWVSEMDVLDLKSYVSSAKEKKENTYLFRFAFDDDYYAAAGVVLSSGKRYDINGVITPLYLNFDIIELGFSDDGVNITTFGVASSPINAGPNIVTGILNGVGSPSGSSDTDIDWTWLKLLIALFAGLFVFYIFINVVGWFLPSKKKTEEKIIIQMPEQSLPLTRSYSNRKYSKGRYRRGRRR